MDHIIIAISTGLYTGMLPIIPGLWGSILALLLWYFCRDLARSIYIAITAGLFCIGWFAAEHAERIFTQQDASPIVIDEMLGIFVTLTAATKIRFGWLYGFLIFIAVDGLKPFPVSWFDTNVHGGFGIMLDDLVAGIFALLLLHFAMRCVYKRQPD